MSEITRPNEDPHLGYSRVLKYLRDSLIRGSLKAGDILLPERELCKLIGVSRPALREALRALSLIGAVEIKHGVGTRISTPSISSIEQYFTFTLAQKYDSLEDIMEARIAIETHAVRLACRKATQSDFSRLESACRLIEKTIDDPKAGAVADFEFHEAIVRAAHSPSLGSVYGAISSLMKQSHADRRARIMTLPGINDYLINHHKKLFLSVLRKDEEKAAELMYEHFDIAIEFERSAMIESSTFIPESGEYH